MESSSSTSKAEVMKPLFLKAGIPLVLTVAGFVSARIILRRNTISEKTKVRSLETIDSSQVQEFRNDHVLDNHVKDDDAQHRITSSPILSSIENSDITHGEFTSFEGEILGLKNRIEELQKKELDLETKFLKYHVMKEQESLLIELKNLLVLEAAHVEFLDREISSMEAEKERFQNLIVEYLRILEQLDFAKLENGTLSRKVKRFSRKMKEQSRIIREKNLKIEAKEAEILKCFDVLETKSSVIKKMEDEVEELKSIVNQLQEEKNELMIKLNAAENSASSTKKVDEESVTMEDYKQLVNELEQLRKDRAAEIAELIYLRWINTCSKHEMMRSQEQEQEQEQENQIEEKKEQDLELEQNVTSVLGHNEFMATSSHHEGSSKRKKLLHKIKKWVEGSDHHLKTKLNEKEKQEINCLGRLSVSEEAEQDHLIHGRMSCSSA